MSEKVTFFPVAEQYAYVAEAIQKKKGISQSRWLSLIIYYCVLNIFLVPAILLFFEMYIAAGISFTLTLFILFIYKSFGESNAYVDFYRQALGNDPEEMGVELLDDGIRTECDDCSSTYAWTSVVEMQNKEDAIYFLMKDCGIAVPKTAFSSPEVISSFLDAASSKISHLHR